MAQTTSRQERLSLHGEGTESNCNYCMVNGWFSEKLREQFTDHSFLAIEEIIDICHSNGCSYKNQSSYEFITEQTDKGTVDNELPLWQLKVSEPRENSSGGSSFVTHALLCVCLVYFYGASQIILRPQNQGYRV